MVATDLLTVVTVLLTLGWMADLVVDTTRMSAVTDVWSQPEKDMDA
ncbi:hypothetical protein [Halorientalis salina]|nr:hypothetical protein [Halorientalis salina]